MIFEILLIINTRDLENYMTVLIMGIILKQEGNNVNCQRKLRRK